MRMPPLLADFIQPRVCNPICAKSLTGPTYVEYGKWFYHADLPLEAVRQLADGVPVTKEMIVALNPKRSEWDEIKAELDEIGYLNKL